MYRSKSFRVLLGMSSLVLAQVLAQASAQEAPAPGPPGGRGGRGGGPGGAARTREFLGLGPAPDAAAAAKGAPLYKQNCATCHGETGRGSQGPSLVRSIVVLHDEKDEEIGPVIKKGRPDAGMPAFPSLSPDDIHNISQYIKMQIELAANRGTYGQTYADKRNQPTGDARRGEAFFSANCTSCHSATGDLAKVGARYSQAALMQSRLLWPATPGPQKATVTTSFGQKVTGTIRQMDDFGISLTDSNGEYHYWDRGHANVQIEDKLAGHRALLPKYSDQDIHDVTTYLLTLK